MTLDEYQADAARTLGTSDENSALVLGALGLAGETGEVVEIVKKHVFHGAPLDREKLVKEIGDVLFYMAALSMACGTTLDHVAKINIEKRRARFPDGWSPEAAKAKADEKP